jgi:hypothetical protein
VGAEYHVHITSTVADGTIVTADTADASTAYYVTTYQFLISDEYHPMETMGDFLAIGNERYVAQYDAGLSFDPHRLTLPPNFRVRCFAKFREYLAIGVWLGTNITDRDEGYVFFWDGISDTPDFYIPIPEGGVNAMFSIQDSLVIVAGYTGQILVYSGGRYANKFNRIPKMIDDNDKYIEISPGSMCMWRSLLHMGVALNTDSTLSHKGVYSLGTANDAYPASLGFDYPTSLGDQTSTDVKIGMVFASGSYLYIGWQNGNAFGIDQINPSNDPYSSAEVDGLISDFAQIAKEKYPLTLRADFNPLNAGERIRLKYKADRSDNWSLGEWEDTTSAMFTRMRLPQRIREFQYGVDMETTVSTSPHLLGVSIEVENESSSRKNI